MDNKIVEYVPDMTQRYPDGQSDYYDDADYEYDLEDCIPVSDIAKEIDDSGDFYNRINIWTTGTPYKPKKFICTVYNTKDLKKYADDLAGNWNWHDADINIYLVFYNKNHVNASKAISGVVRNILEGTSVRDAILQAVTEKKAMRLGDFKVGQKVIWHTDDRVDGKNSYPGTVKSTFDDHILVDIPQFNDHCWFDASDLDALELVESKSVDPKKVKSVIDNLNSGAFNLKWNGWSFAGGRDWGDWDQFSISTSGDEIGYINLSPDEDEALVFIPNDDGTGDDVLDVTGSDVTKLAKAVEKAIKRDDSAFINKVTDSDGKICWPRDFGDISREEVLSGAWVPNAE